MRYARDTPEMRQRYARDASGGYMERCVGVETAPGPGGTPGSRRLRTAGMLRICGNAGALPTSLTIGQHFSVLGDLTRAANTLARSGRVEDPRR